MHANVFSALEIFLEFGLAFYLALLANQVMFGNPSVHLLSAALITWTPPNLHSENPFTQASGNPILDYIFKPNIAHNLHHAFQLDPLYMASTPMHHWNPSDRAADVDRYNEIMKSKVDVCVFI
jgi:hypothetical protein